MNNLDIGDLHWAMQIISEMDAGLIVLDSNYQVCAWNNFMQSYSGVTADKILGKSLFEVVGQLPEVWLKKKVDTAFRLNTRGFSSWEDRPFLFRFKNFSPISSGLVEMRQNITFTPLTSVNGKVSHVSITINDVTDVAKSKMHLTKTNQYLEDLSRTDGLTKLFNRRYWESCLEHEFEMSRMTGRPSTLVIFDIDHFKKVNDTYGHTVGDVVIFETAEALRKASRNSDISGRYGGEEFTVILPATCADQAQYFAERLRKRIENSIISAEGYEIRYTVSLGICQLTAEHENYTAWLENADRALYSSKENGRNQSSVYTKLMV